MQKIILTLITVISFQTFASDTELKKTTGPEVDTKAMATIVKPSKEKVKKTQKQILKERKKIKKNFKAEHKDDVESAPVAPAGE